MFVLEAGQFIDGSGAAPRQKIRLIIERGKIVEILEAGASVIPAGVDFYDASELTVMPGMIDAHVHVIWSGVPGDPLAGRDGQVGELPGTFALEAYANARKDLEAGFTALRDMLSYDFADISLRNAINKGIVQGPRISACGYGLTATGGHMDLRSGLRPDVSLGYFNNIVDTPEQARIAVRYLVRMGVDHIKINAGRGYRVKGRPILFAPEMRLDVLQVICEEAHTAGRTVAAHSLGSDGEYWAVQAGVDSLEHAHFIDDRTIELMAERGTFLVPTMTHCVRNTLDIRQNLSPEMWVNNLILNAYDSMYRVIPKAFQMGVPIVTGTDAGADNVPHGCNALELELLTTIGMSPLQAIHAATGAAARLLDMADSIGVLREGLCADLLLVRGDPLQDIRLLQDPANILAVFKDGRPVVDRRSKEEQHVSVV